MPGNGRYHTGDSAQEGCEYVASTCREDNLPIIPAIKWVEQVSASGGTIKPRSVYAACGCRAQGGHRAKSLVTLLRDGDCAMPDLQGAN